jgi:Sulfotransferase domain
LPVFRVNKAIGLRRGVKAFLSLEGGFTDGKNPEAELRQARTEQPKIAQRRTAELRRSLRSKRRELSSLAEELHAAKRQLDGAKVEQIRKVKVKKQEIFRLKNDLRAAKLGVESEPETGALPDFAIIGAPKCGTTFLYHLLTKHPHVEPAAFKEPHYFDLLFGKGIEWYRQCFLAPRLKDGRKTITGEATPGYLFHPRAPQRMAEVVPQARLIALLRNPVDRTYSAYHFFKVRHGRERGTFEEAIEAYLDRSHHGRLIQQGVYVDHLLRWSRFFSDEQMLVLKSEDFFEHQQGTLKRVLDFLELPDWEPEASELRDKVNKGKYEQGMDPATRRRLEDFFEPHNQRLYEYLGVDFGW